MQQTAAADPVLVKDTTTRTFREDVLQESMRRPVLVDFWAPWCEPCKQLGPVLERVVGKAGGKVVLVKLNIDEHRQIPQQLGIQSIPAVFAFSRGQPVDGFVGNLPESQVKAFIERLVGPLGMDIAEVIAAAEQAAAEGDPEGAAELYGAVLAEEPENAKALAGLAKLQLDAGAIDQAKRILATVPAGAANDPAVSGVRAAIELAEQTAALGDPRALESRLAADPNDFQARFDLALIQNARGEREAAIDNLVMIVRKNRSWNDDGARRQLLQFFEAWGPMDEMTILGRRRLSSVLFS